MRVSVSVCLQAQARLNALRLFPQVAQDREWVSEYARENESERERERARAMAAQDRWSIRSMHYEHTSHAHPHTPTHRSLGFQTDMRSHSLTQHTARSVIVFLFFIVVVIVIIVLLLCCIQFG